VKFDLSEALLGWTRLYERLQLDELPAGCWSRLLLVWFSARAYGEARDNWAMRRATTPVLAEALAENHGLRSNTSTCRNTSASACARPA